jgi:hypothetical protein
MRLIHIASLRSYLDVPPLKVDVNVYVVSITDWKQLVDGHMGIPWRTSLLSTTFRIPLYH